MRERRKLNAFNLSHEHKLTCEMGYLIPNLLMEVVPGDTFDIKSSIFARAEAMLAPVMHRYDVIQHYFYWPKRCSMPKYWEDYYTGGEDGTDNTTWPYMVSPATGYARGSLGDYLGLPCDTRVDTSANSTETNQIQGAFEHSAVPFRMYSEIFNYWYRNENLQSKLVWSDQPGLDTTTNTTLQKKNWSKDYFTGALDRTERGSPTYLPFTDSDVPVIGNGKTLGLTDGTTNVGMAINNSSAQPHGIFTNTNYGTAVGTTSAGTNLYSGKTMGITTDPEKSGLIAKTSNVVSLLYADLQKSARMALFKRRLERAGSRLVEFTSEFFGVRVPDDRICKPVFLGGFRCPLMITPVEQTSSSDSVSPQGNLAGRGTSSGAGKKIRKSFVEEGLIMGIMCIMPKAEYSQGTHKLWLRKTRWDHFVPMFDVAGDQEILNQEIYTQGTSADGQSFGYKPAFEELRRIPSSTHGEMRKGGSLMFWTGGRVFDSLPQLNSQFVTADPSNRIFAVTDAGVHHFTVEAYHEVRALRLLDKYGNPAII